MSGSEAAVPTKRNWWVIGAFVGLASVLIGMKCLCPDPAAAFRAQATGAADVRGAPLRAAPEPATPAAATAPTPETAVQVGPPVRDDVAQSPPAVVEPTPRTPVEPPPSEPTAAPVVASKPAETSKPAEKPGVAAAAASSKVVKITWDDISKYTYVPPDPDADPTALQTKEKADADQIPADVRAMSGKRYSIEGYVVPLDYEKGIVTKFIILPSPLACCFAEAPPMNRWIMVSNDSKAEFDYGKYNMLRATGVFDVGEEKREGYVVGIYRMKAEKVEIVEE